MYSDKYMQVPRAAYSHTMAGIFIANAMHVVSPIPAELRHYYTQGKLQMWDYKPAVREQATVKGRIRTFQLVVNVWLSPYLLKWSRCSPTRTGENVTKIAMSAISVVYSFHKKKYVCLAVCLFPECILGVHALWDQNMTDPHHYITHTQPEVPCCIFIGREQICYFYDCHLL